MKEFNLAPFDHLAGSLSKWSHRSCVMAMLDTVKSMRDAINTPEINPDLEKQYRDLAVLADDDIDPMDWNNFCEQWLNAFLPAYCSLSWDDGEYRVRPYIDDKLPRLTRLPTDNRGYDINPDHADHILIVNDHHDTTLFEWHDKTTDGTNSAQNQWHEIWSVA